MRFAFLSLAGRRTETEVAGRAYDTYVVVESAGGSETRLTYPREAESWATLGESAAQPHTQQFFDTNSFSVRYGDCNM